MSIQSEIDRINGNISDTYSVLSDLGADTPSVANSNNLSSTAESIKAVLYSEQTLTDAQKVRARNNIGAGISNFSGDYNDLTNRPTIPAAVTESTVYGWGFTKNAGTYSKPSGGIPKTDLAQSVQSSLNKADTALQSYTETDPVFTASPAHGITAANITSWNNKGTYSKPSTGIPKTDLASAVQTSLGLADTALQSYTETDPIFVASAAHGITASNISDWNGKISMPSGGTTGQFLQKTGSGVAWADVDNISDENVVMTDFDGTLREAFQYAGGALMEIEGGLTNLGEYVEGLSIFMNEKVPEAPGDNKVYGRKNGEWEEVPSGTDNFEALNNRPKYNNSVMTGSTNIPIVPTALSALSADSTHRLVTDTEKSTWNSKGTYSKPSGGIPKTDLASAVQTSLGLADTALQSYTETDPIFSASVAAGISASDITTWNSKGTYSKPSGGIPKTDLASAVQTSLGKADSALQSYTETDPVFAASAASSITSTDITNWNGKTSNTGTVTSVTVKMNGSTKGTVTSSGTIELGTIITEETDPTVPSWAKATNKPTYTASEVGAVPTTRKVAGKALSSDISLVASDIAFQSNNFEGQIVNVDEALEQLQSSKLATPSGGTVGQVLKKTATGIEWANESGGGGSSDAESLSDSEIEALWNSVWEATT